MKVTGVFCRLVCLLLVSLFIIPTALADKVDLSLMTDDEVVALLTQVNDEIVSRGINKTASLPQGSYFGGKDIPVGKYIFVCKAKGDDWGNVTVKTDGGNGKLVLWEVVSAPKDGEEPEEIFITLGEGDELNSGVPFTLSIMSGAIFK